MHQFDEFLWNNVKCKTTIPKGYIWFHLLKYSGNNKILEMENMGCLCSTSYNYMWNANNLKLRISIIQSRVDDFIVVAHHTVHSQTKGLKHNHTIQP